ncbi:hypothetical protein V474_03205 [Novosphingobium barchaimii LL02]|uniref:Uncharacterized protein n=1 Tax=Novosphingobium barchaimii LL02 TaxID=1114963 RepID=A0A0J7XI01_9SPHN|nr:hypothetical protein [Novosphingobium barchaimii]KMS51651.1 hypothetical protein V474_03205 [Novosphingobium barchaimii LL02]
MEPDTARIELRRATHDFNESLVDLVVRLTPVDGDAAAAVKRARSALFEAWTILCSPPEDDDDHDH